MSYIWVLGGYPWGVSLPGGYPRVGYFTWRVPMGGWSLQKTHPWVPMQQPTRRDHSIIRPVVHVRSETPCVPKQTNEIGWISRLTDRYTRRNSVMSILLNLSMNNFYCRYFKSNITKEVLESLRFDWSVSAHRVLVDCSSMLHCQAGYLGVYI